MRETLTKIRRLRLQIMELESRAEGTASKPLTGMPHGSGTKADVLDCLTDLTIEYDRLCSGINLNVLPDMYQKVIWLRYYRAYSWKEIQAVSGRPMQSIFNMHSKALRILEKK